MAISVVMPALEMAQETGKLLAWRKREGESVRKGEPLLEIETDKAVVEVEAPGDGMLAGITADVGAVIPVGETIAWLVAPGEKPPAKAATTTAPGARAVSGAAQQNSGVAQAAATAKAAVAGTAPQVSPKARRLAKELGIDLALVRGTGPEGVITAEDVQKLAGSRGRANAPATTPSSGVEPLSQVARLMAERTTQSWTSVPHFFLVRDVDAHELIAAQRRLGEEAERSQSTAPTITDLLIAFIARVLARHQRMNASWTSEGIRSNPEINVSLAAAVKDGVVGAVIHNADKLQISEISAQRRELIERARTGKLRPADITGGTFTLSNLGMYQVDAFSAIITPPQAAVLAVGAISDRVIAVEGKPAVRPMMMMTLSSDHRVVDGARAAEFLNDLAGAVREPMKLL
ncbi:MAG TPA: dihydrolipoamide acetyltransferase family protein [Candidatus Bathyarchaeia archaeon]|jgi:pyruvate dehydrogenase E2 component (dihydrolipoamide acetyltransferase)|nr:dihydrolipoamide acetyltransferase family protein [Candidatus Bathyarchaeia archaeon]